MRFLCRWHIPWSRVPSQRPVGLAIAIVIVGGPLLDAGAISRTPRESSVSPAPIAAITGSGEALVVMARSGRDTTLAREGVGIAVSGSVAVLAAITPAGDPMLLEVPGAWSPTVQDAGAPDSLTKRLRALDADEPAELLVLSALATTVGPSADRDAATDAGAPATTTKARKHPHWWRKAGPWRISPKVTWYGPGFYGNRTACGQRYSRYVLGVAHRTLPCGTMVQFRWHGRVAVAPVIDRGPYGPKGYLFDWSAWLACRTFRPKGMRNGCFTRADVHFRVVGRVDLDQWFRRKKKHKR